MTQHMLSANAPRVTRSPFVDKTQIYVMRGDLFEDGRERYFVGTAFTDEQATELSNILDARDDAKERLDKLVATVNRAMVQMANRGYDNRHNDVLSLMGGHD